MAGTIFNDINPNTTSGNQLATLLNDFKDAVASGFSGTTRPSNLQAGGYWIDTTNDPTTWDYKLYDGTSDITIFTLDLASGTATTSNASTLFQISKVSNDAVGPILKLLKERIAGGGQSLTDDVLGEIRFFGNSDLGADTLQAKIISASLDDTTSTESGAYIAFEVTSVNTNTLVEVMRIINSSVGIGTLSPSDKLHVVGNGSRVERLADDAVGSKFNIKKGRVASNGQVLNNDIIGEVNFLSKDNAGTEVAAAQIDTFAAETHTSSAHGTTMRFKVKKIGQTSYTTQMTIGDTGVVITDLVVTNLTATNAYLGTVVEFTDALFIVNKGGTQANANAVNAGFKVEMSDATHAQIGYDSTKASKFVIGNVGSLVEIADVSSAQTFTNKTISGANIQSPVRLDVKKDTEANLTTYAATAENGQWCFATDTKTMYQVIDTELVPAGAGGGGSSLVWKKTGDLSPTTRFVDGLELQDFAYDQAGQELYCTIVVPGSYRAGKPIKLKKAAFFANTNANNVFFKTVATLLEDGVTTLGTYTNQRTSTNTQVTLTNSNRLTAIGDFDLTDSTGQINSVAVAPGDKIRVRLYRDIAAETVPAAVDAGLLIDCMELTLS